MGAPDDGKGDTSQALGPKVELELKQGQEPAVSGCSLNFEIFFGLIAREFESKKSARLRKLL